MKNYAIYGASGCGRGVLPLVRQSLREESGAEEVELVFVDDGQGVELLNGERVLTYEKWISEAKGTKHISLAISNGLIRKNLAEKCIADGVNFFEIRASNIVQLDDVKIAEGAILCPFVTMTSNIKIGKHFHANIYSYIEHDCIIGDYVTFGPGVKCNGNVQIEDYAYIGSGAIIKQGLPSKPLIIGRGAVVGMGAVVTKNVPAGVTVIGNPARQLVKP